MSAVPSHYKEKGCDETTCNVASQGAVCPYQHFAYGYSALPCAGLLTSVARYRPRGTGYLPRSGRSADGMPPARKTTPRGHTPHREERCLRQWPLTKNVALASD